MSENEIMKLMNTINYGWIDKNGKQHINDFFNFSKDYILQSPNELKNNKIGVCWDQVELERDYFKNYESVRTFFIVHYDNDQYPTHTFLTYKIENNYYWFEHSWEKFRGIHKYDSMDLLLKDVYNKYVQSVLRDKYNKNNLIVYEYSKPQYHISVHQFFYHCENGSIIEL